MSSFPPSSLPASSLPPSRQLSRVPGALVVAHGGEERPGELRARRGVERDLRGLLGLRHRRVLVVARSEHERRSRRQRRDVSEENRPDDLRRYHRRVVDLGRARVADDREEQPRHGAPLDAEPSRRWDRRRRRGRRETCRPTEADRRLSAGLQYHPAVQPLAWAAPQWLPVHGSDVQPASAVGGMSPSQDEGAPASAVGAPCPVPQMSVRGTQTFSAAPFTVATETQA